MELFDVYRDRDGDYVIVPSEAEFIQAPVLVACCSSAATGGLPALEAYINSNLVGFNESLTLVKEQHILDQFGPYKFIGIIEVDV